MKHTLPALLLLLCCPALRAADKSVEVDTLEGKLEEVMVLGREPRTGVVERIDVRPLSKLSGASSSFENILKVLPGVHSTNELSSQYSVRGGSYDENLVYVNGVEIYRPTLTRTGQQEGLSFINPNLVSTIDFSTGGFGAEFGDKMSSVLNVSYRRPTSHGGSAEGNLLGAAATCDFASANKKFGGVVGMRYKRATYLLGTLDVKGEYNPSFSDVQTALYFEPVRALSFSLLGSYALNRYSFTPTNRQTTFGTLDNPMNFTMYYEGGESDLTQNLLGALTVRYRASDNVMLTLTGSAVAMQEQERYDILGEYWLKQTITDAEVNHDATDMGVGRSLNHARNYTATNVYVAEHGGSWHHSSGALRWGLKVQRYHVSDEVSQWQQIDSAGYMMPRSENELGMMSSVHADTFMSARQYSGFLQESYTLQLGNSHLLRITPGLRLTYASLSRELLAAPRLQAIFYPNGEKDWQIFASAGAYHQPAFFKEMKNPKMQLNTSVTAQRSWHFTLGTSATFTGYGIPCRLTSEAYYKQLSNLVPYKQDNVVLLYDWQRRADGFVWGVDAKLSAELTKGAESWLSLSLMQARQDVRGDAYESGAGQAVAPGYFPMPNDQRLNLSLMLQDQVLHYSQWRACLVLNYGTGLPSFAPVDNRYDLTFRMPAYQRVDMGLSYVLFDSVARSALKQQLGSVLQSCIFTVEALNLFNIRNISSYLWVKTVQYAGQQSGMVAVPNYLTPFRINVKVGVTF
ncbi:MAG: TonB-dependent receptor plug domain-containing protein [Prevotellaceae bacterium]|nr:TonB-dependent receptor plug domain-containing protein [Prevotellaceae bacterium]